MDPTRRPAGASRDRPAAELPPLAEQWLERAADWALGLTALGWAVRDVVRGQGATVVGGTLIALNASVGLLFLARQRAEGKARFATSAWCLASVVSSGLVLGAAPSPGQWGRWASLLFALGGAGALLSFVTLGRRFGVLPAWRGLASQGPYRIVRHPGYASELLMVLACALAGRSWPSAVAAAVAALLVVLRIQLEEAWLKGQAEYRQYARRVRSRLLPGLW